MSEYKILTAESVTEGHPDKLCDIIADSVLDACLESDPTSRVACEVLATAGKVIVAGEITTEEMPDIPYIVSRTIKHIGYDGLEYEIECLIHDQSGDIARPWTGWTAAFISTAKMVSLWMKAAPLAPGIRESCMATPPPKPKRCCPCP